MHLVASAEEGSAMTPERLEQLRAIDIHTHCEVHHDGSIAMPDHLLEAMGRHFRAGTDWPDIDDLAAYYRERDIACVTFSVDAERVLGVPPVPSEAIAEGAARHADVLIPFGSVDPLVEGAPERAASLVTEHGVRGIKLHPTLQAFRPDDRLVYPLYEAIAAAGVPVLVHTGQSGVGAGVRGGGGLRLSYSNPMHLDAVAADFPDLDVVFAHPSFPWQEEALAVAVHKRNVWIDLSGWSPKHFPPILVTYINRFLSDRVLFGSDYPAITPDRWLADFDRLPISDEVRPAVLKDNAVRLLGLEAASGVTQPVG